MSTLQSVMNPPEWMADAACAETDPEIFFPEYTPGKQSARQAKLVCRGCAVVAECLTAAIANSDQGVWGGTTERERRRLRRAVA